MTRAPRGMSLEELRAELSHLREEADPDQQGRRRQIRDEIFHRREEAHRAWLAQRYPEGS